MQNGNINGLNIFENTFLYTAYQDDSTFFLKEKKFVVELMKIFDVFLTFSGLKQNKSKYETAGLGALKGVNLALCGLERINLMFNAIKILEVYYSYDKNFENQENFINPVLKIEKPLRLWRMRNLFIACKITVFKTLVISKIVHLTLVKIIPNSIILDTIKKYSIWKNGNTKIKQSTLCKDYENGCLINVEVTVTGLEPSTSQFINEHSTIQPNRPND